MFPGRRPGGGSAASRVSRARASARRSSRRSPRSGGSATGSAAGFAESPKPVSGRARASSRSPRTRCASRKLGLASSTWSISASATSGRLRAISRMPRTTEASTSLPARSPPSIGAPGAGSAMAAPDGVPALRLLPGVLSCKRTSSAGPTSSNSAAPAEASSVSTTTGAARPVIWPSHARPEDFTSRSPGTGQSDDIARSITGRPVPARSASDHRRVPASAFSANWLSASATGNPGGTRPTCDRARAA